MIRIGAMVSGGGTNLQAVLDAIDAGKIDGQVVTVVSSKECRFNYIGRIYDNIR